MSYARFGPDSDVYVYSSECGYVCSWCTLQTEPDPEYDDHFVTKSASEMIQHLEQHRAAGHKVPDYTIKELQEEPAEDEPSHD